jgi:hypothetical protein
MSPLAIFLFGLILMAIIMSCGGSYLYDKYKWNKGKSRKSGEGWSFVGKDDCNDRMYETPSGERCTISWNID